MRVYTGLRRRSARFQRLAAILYRHIGEAPWNDPVTSTHHDQAVVLTGYARHYDQLADAIDRAAVIADSSRLVSQFLMVTVALGSPSAAAVNVNDDDVNWGSWI